MANRILFCSDVTLTRKLGAAKVVMEVAESMAAQGWECRLAGPEEICPGLERLSGIERAATFCSSLRRFLQEQAGNYDVVDYGYQYLPYPRQDFAARTLFVARSVLLTHHLATIPIPQPTTWRPRLAHMVRSQREKRYLQFEIRNGTCTAQHADVVNVSNAHDREALLRHGIEAAKIVVLPFGISPALRPRFDAVPSEVPARPIVAFVGTFDYRKGAAEFPRLVAAVSRMVPGVRFRLLGTKGLFQTREQVLAHFPPALAVHIEVVPEYAPEALPELLAPCSVGVFPSHIEGFGFGVVEMLAAALPVFAYNVPGPPMMLPSEYLVARGDVPALGAKVANLMLDRQRLRAARIWARQQSRPFDWERIAAETSTIYRRHWAPLGGV